MALNPHRVENDDVASLEKRVRILERALSKLLYLLIRNAPDKEYETLSELNEIQHLVL